MAVYTAKILVGGGSPIPDTPGGRRTVIPISSGNIELSTVSNNVPIAGLPLRQRAAFGVGGGMRPSPHAPYQANTLLITVTGVSFDSAAVNARNVANELSNLVESGAIEVRNEEGVELTRSDLFALVDEGNPTHNLIEE